MRRFFILFPLIAVLSLVQGLMRGIIVIHGIALVPDFSLIFLVLFSIEFGRGVGQSAGFFGGILEDFAMAKPLGFTALVKMLIGTTFGVLQGRFMVGALLIALWSVAIATLMKYGLTWLLGFFMNIHTFQVIPMLMSLAVELVLNLITTIPAFWITKKILKSAADYIRREQKIS
ncbi:rod shape-determining protein MreD [Entomospira entomophila]|uniref:Rod shape-determining protein MreD n=1 Tax=Entomospira entomophila TaxID=2719988 RepID=A0A968GBW2_9SPIO|nr:rod shape-determining protein MreD [Entomospira entomophilus]NIZ40526.1 rod shape-determining protein MreD [Entomospira entomophilus]WDI36084.1 rod shape-determining protein MreD [Entomospira entomophilus]